MSIYAIDLPKNFITIDFETTAAGQLKVNFKDILGKDVTTVFTNDITLGNNKLIIDLAKYSIQSGIYFLELSVDNQPSYVQKLVIAE